MSINFNPRNALSVAQNQYSAPKSTPASSSVNTGASSGSSSGSGGSSSNSSGTNTNSNSGSDLFNPNWTGGSSSNSNNVNTTNTANNNVANTQNNNPHTYSIGHYLQQGLSYADATKALANARAIANQNKTVETSKIEENTENNWMTDFNNIQRQNQEIAKQQAEAQRQQTEQWQKRQDEMNRNMQRMQAEEADFMTNREKFERMTGYATKNEQERKVVDDYWNNNSNIAKPRNAGDYYNDIKNGVAVANHEKNRPEYIQAEATYGRIQKYKSMNSGQLANLFKTGELTSGDLALLHKENPNLAMDIAFTNSINNSGQVNFDADQLAMSNDIIKNWFTDMQNDERQSLLSNALSSDPNIANAMADTKRKADKLGELQKTVLSVSEEVDKELEGKNAPKSYAEALKMKRSSAIHTAIASAQIDYSNAMNYQRDLIENKKYDIDYQRQLENRKFQVGQNIFMGRENVALGLQKAQAEFEQKIRQDDMVRNNPRLATQAMIDSYRKQGVNAMRSDAEIIADIEQKVASGQSLGEALTELNKAFQSKEEYKTLQRLHNGRLSDMEQIQLKQMQAERENALAMQKMAVANEYELQNTLMKYDLNNKQEQQKAIQELVTSGKMSGAEAKATMRNINNNWDGANGAELLFAEDGTFIKSTMYTAENGTNKKGGIECAEYISRMMGMKIGSTWEEKKALNKEKTGKIGSIMVWQPSKTGEFGKYGHAGIIIGEDGDNWIVKNANYKVDGRISTIKVPKNTAGARYRSTNLLQNIGVNSANTNNSNNPLTGAVQPYLDAVNAGTMSIQDAIKEFGTGKEGIPYKNELMRLYGQQGGQQFNATKSGEYQELANQIEELKSLRDDPMMDASVGPDGTGLFSRTSINPWNWGDKDAYLARANKVLNNSVLNKLIEAKANGATFGALSDTELNMLKNSSNTLNALAIKDEDGNITGFKGTEEQFKKEVDKMIAHTELVMKRMSQKGVQNGGMLQNVKNFGENLITSKGINLSNYFN